MSLGVESQGEWYCSLHAPAKSIEALVRKPDEAELLKLLLKAGISSAGQPERSDEEKLVELGLSLGIEASCPAPQRSRGSHSGSDEALRSRP